MRRGIIAMGLVAGAWASVAPPAWAEPPPVPAATVSATPTPSIAHGVAVLAAPGATDAAWPLAQALYSDASLRPAGIDEARARILCGEPPAADAPPDLRDLAETVAAVRSEDAPSRAILGEIARRLAVAAIVVVHADAGHAATGRVYVVESHDFDAATYAPDATPGGGWSAVTRSLDRAFGSAPPTAPAPTPPPTSPGPDSPPAAPSSPATPPAVGHAPSPPATPTVAAPALATRDAPKPAESKKARPFYVSPWFWGALGVAALAGGGAYLLSRDTGSSTIHLQVQGPQ